MALHCYDIGDQAETTTTSLLILYCHHYWRLFFEASYKALYLIIFITEIWGSFIIIVFIVISAPRSGRSLGQGESDN